LLCFALLCFALLCFALLCFALLCFALPRSADWSRCNSKDIVSRVLYCAQ
jgi:hypothetical protein